MSISSTTTHEIHCQDPWFSFVKSGQKRVEGRKNSPAYQHLRPGDRLVFRLDQERFTTRIVALRRYATLDDYLLTEGVDRVLPTITTLAAARAIYLQWSTAEQIERYGFLAIEVARE